MFCFVSETTRDITEREVGETTRWRNDRLPNTEVLYSDPFLERPEKHFSACMFIYIHDQSIKLFEGRATKLSVKETNWTGL